MFSTSLKSIIFNNRKPSTPRPSTPRPTPQADLVNRESDNDADLDIIYDSSRIDETISRLKELINKQENIQTEKASNLEPITESRESFSFADLARNDKINSIRLRRAQSLDQTNKKKVQNIQETAPVSTTIPAIPSISLKTQNSLKPPTTIRRTVSLAQQTPVKLTEPIPKKPFLKRKSVTFKDL